MTDDTITNVPSDVRPDHQDTETSVAEAPPEAAPATPSETESEADLLRLELQNTQTALEDAKKEISELKAKHLRGLAEVQTVRRRMQQETTRAKEQGADSVILSVLPVYDDLRRALEAASDDPSQIVPGVEKVRETLKRNLETLGIVETGAVGEVFDPNLHEALTAMPTEEEEKKGTIAQVFESGFMKDERVVRAARVVVYQT